MVNMKIKFFLLLTILLVVLCGLGTVCAEENVSDVDMTLGSPSPITPVNVDNWNDLKNYCESPNDQIVYLNGSFTIDSQILINNSVTIIGDADYYIGGTANNVNTYSNVAFLCNDALNVTFTNVNFQYTGGKNLMQFNGNGNYNIDNCNFNNVNSGSDRSIILSNSGLTNIVDSTFSDCNIKSGIIINNADLLVSNSVFENNIASLWAGAIHTNEYATTTIFDSIFRNNRAGWNGGALYDYGILYIYNSTFDSNNCTTNNGGGAIGACKLGTFEPYIYVVNSTFINNINTCKYLDNLSTTGLGRGGAISFMDDGMLKVYNNTFIGNDAKIGSAICAISQGSYGSPDVEIVGNKFINHTGVGTDVLVVSLSNSNYLVENNNYSNNKISVGKFRLDIEEDNGDVSVNVTLRLKHPEYYDSDIITRSGFAVYADYNYTDKKIFHDTSFSLNLTSGENHNIEVVPLFLNNVSINKNSNDPKYNTIYVSTTGSDLNNGITRNTAVRTISKAIQLASTVDYVKILEGTYYERDLIISYDIIIEGEGNVILMGNSSSINTFTVNSGSVAFNNLQFTGITGGKAISTQDDFVVCVNNCSFYSNNAASRIIDVYGLDIEDSIINDNIANYMVYASKLNMANCIVYGNSLRSFTQTSYGIVYTTEGNIYNSTFTSNNARNGILRISGNNITIEESKFINNSVKNGKSASNGGAIYATATNINIISSVFYNNYAYSNGGAIYLTNTVNNLNITNSVLIGNTATSYNYQIGRQGSTQNVFAINNWWGNTIDNPYVAPTFQNNNNVNASIWLILNVTSNVTSLSSGESALVTFDLTYTNILGSDAPNGTNITGNLTPFCIDGVYLPILDGVLTATNGVVNVSEVSLIDGKVSVVFTATSTNPYLTIDILGKSESIYFNGNRLLRLDEINDISTDFINFDGLISSKKSPQKNLLGIGPNPDDWSDEYPFGMSVQIYVFNNVAVMWVYFNEELWYNWADDEDMYDKFDFEIPDKYLDGENNVHLNVSLYDSITDEWNDVIQDSFFVPFPNAALLHSYSNPLFFFNITKGLYKFSFTYDGQDIEYEYEEGTAIYKYPPINWECELEISDFTIATIENLNSIVSYENSNVLISPTVSCLFDEESAPYYIDEDVDGHGSNYELQIFDFKNVEYDEEPLDDFEFDNSRYNPDYFPVVKPVNIIMTVTQGDNIIENFSVTPGDSYSLDNLTAGEYNLTAVYDDPYYGHATKTVSISIYGNHIWETEGADIGYSHKTDYSGPKNIQELWNLSVNNFQGPVIDFDGNIYIANGTNILVLDSNGNVINTYSMNNPSKGLLLWKDLLFTSRFSSFDDGAEWFRINDVMSDRNYEFIPTGAGNDATSRSDYAPVYSDGKIIYIIPEFDYGTNSYTRAHLLVYNADEPSGRTITYQGQTRPAYGTISKSSTFARETGAASVDSAGNIYVNTRDGLIIFNSNLVKYDLSFGDAGSYGRPVIDSVDNVYVFNSDRTKVYAINIDDEKTMLWNKTIAGGACGVMAVDVENNALYIVGNDAIVYSFNRANGEMSEFFNLGTNASSILVDGKGTLYIGGKNGILYAISNEGKKLFEYEIGGTINANMVLDNDETLYVHANGKLFALTRAPKLYSEIIINVSDAEVNRNNTIVAILPENATGNVTFIIDDTITSGDVPIINGNATWTAPGLKEGNHKVTVTWIGNDDYNGNTKTEEFNIYKVNSTIDLADSFNYVGKLTQLNITLPSDAVGNVSVTFNRKTESVKIVNGTATFEISDLEAGNYTIDFSWEGDERYFGNSSYAYFTVIKNDAGLTIAADPIREGQDLKVTVTVSDDESGIILISVGDIKDYAQIKEGIAEFTISGLAADTYDITATYMGDRKYNNATSSSQVTVSPKDEASISISPDVVVEDEKQSIEITLPDDATGNVLVEVNGNTFYAEVNGGKVSVPVAGLEANTTYPVTVTYSGNDIYSETTEEGEVTTPEEPVVEPLNPGLKLSVQDTVITVSINDDATGLVIITVGDISFVFDTSELEPVDVSEYLTNGTYDVEVIYLGDEVFMNATDSGNVTVPEEPIIEPLDPELDVDIQNTTITVSINEEATGLVIITVGDISFVMDAGELAPVDVADYLSNGTYPVSVEYLGDDVFGEALFIGGTVTVPEEPVIEPKDPNLKATAANTAITATLNKDATGNVLVDVDGNGYYAPIKNGKAVIEVMGLEAGKTYDALVSYAGDDNFKASNVTVKVTVPKDGPAEPKDPNLKLNIKDTVITVSINDAATGTVIIGVGDIAFVQDASELTPIDVSDYLVSGTYPVTVKYLGDDVFANATKSGSVTVPDEPVVEPKDPELKAFAEDSDVIITLNKDATGMLLVDVEGTVLFFPALGEPIVVDLFFLNPGNYTIGVEYLGDEVFAPANATVTLSIPEDERKDAGLKASVSGTELTVSLDKNATGYVLAGVEGGLLFYEYEGKDIVVDLSYLEAGNYSIIVMYSGDEAFYPAETSANITIPEEPVVEPKDPNLKATATNATINVSVDKDATGNILVDVDGTGYYAPIKNGQATVNIIGLDEGKYQATVTYAGDDVFKAANTTVSITVPKKEDSVPEPVDPKADISISEDGVDITLPKDATGYMLVDVDGTGYYVPVKDGKASLDLPELAPGNHTVTATYTGDKKYDSANATKTISVENPIETIVSENLTKVEKSPDRFEATFTDAQGKALANTDVKFVISGNTYTRTTDANGKAGMNINLPAGNYSVTVINPVTNESKVNTITVLLRLEGNDLVKYFKNASQFYVKVFDDNGNPVKAGEVVTFNINGVFYNRTTDSNGMAKLSINLIDGDYVITSEYKGCKIANNIKVLPILTAKDLTKQYGKSGAFEATLVDGQGKAYANQQVEFNINGVFYKRTTDANGVAKLNINLQAGKYIVTSSYGGFSIANTVTVTA